MLTLTVNPLKSGVQIRSCVSCYGASCCLTGVLLFVMHTMHTHTFQEIISPYRWPQSMGLNQVSLSFENLDATGRVILSTLITMIGTSMNVM